MQPLVRIFRSDNSNTRRAKSSFKRTLKSRSKHVGIHTSPSKKRKKKSTAKQIRRFLYSPIKYDENVELFCKVNNLTQWKDHSTKFDLDSDFSLFGNPERVLKHMLGILYQAKMKRKFITLNYKESFDFGALFLLDNMCWQIAKKKKWEIRANLPPKEVAVFQNLKSIATNSSETKYAYMLNHAIKINRSDNVLAKQEHKRKSKEMRDLIIRGMRENYEGDFDLSHQANTAIDSAISEHFDNILLHVPTAEYGHMWGFFDKANKSVTILIYNFGNSIAETLSNRVLPDHVQSAVEQIIENHAQKTIIERTLGWGTSFTRENALTLLAIQEGISSVLVKDKTRGHGLIDYVSHCFELNPESKITIISGHTAINIDKKYAIGNVDVFNRIRKIIALNDSNDIFAKPDDNYVKNMGIYFPGVIIETTIPLLIN